MLGVQAQALSQEKTEDTEVIHCSHCHDVVVKEVFNRCCLTDSSRDGVDDEGRLRDGGEMIRMIC